jgi:hypothetical protein
MHKIGIIGHSAEYFPEKEPIKQIIENTISLINFQYGENLLINLDGNIGVSHWVADVCLTLGIKYHLFLPSPKIYLNILVHLGPIQYVLRSIISQIIMFFWSIAQVLLYVFGWASDRAVHLIASSIVCKQIN